MKISKQERSVVSTINPRTQFTLTFVAILLTIANSISAASETIRILGKRNYETISAAVSAARDGDVIEIPTGDYDHVSATLTADNVTVRGVGGRPRLNANGKPSNGKGHFHVKGNHSTFENLELFGSYMKLGAEDAWNQGAIVLEGRNIALRDMYIHDNGQGLFTEWNVGTVDIRNSEFSFNGQGGGHSHNLYINHEVAKLVMRGVWSRDCNGGHILKSRALENDVQGCLFTDSKGTSLNWYIDFPNGGNITFCGNIVVSGPNTELLFAYGEDPNPINPGSAVRIHQNTFINNGRGKFFQLLNGGKPVYSGNIFSGPNSLSIENNREVGSKDFINFRSFDYRLKSPIFGTDPLADASYVHPAGFKSREDNVYGACPLNISAVSRAGQ